MKETTSVAMPPCFHRWCDRFNNVFKTKAQKNGFRDYIGGLLGESQRKNLSQIANNTVGLSYHKLRHFLVRANWSVDAGMGASSSSDVGMSSNKTFSFICFNSRRFRPREKVVV